MPAVAILIMFNSYGSAFDALYGCCPTLVLALIKNGLPPSHEEGLLQVQFATQDCCSYCCPAALLQWQGTLATDSDA